MTLRFNRKGLLISAFMLAGFQAAFAQSSDSSSVHSIDTLNFDQISNDYLATPAATPAVSPSVPAGAVTTLPSAPSPEGTINPAPAADSNAAVGSPVNASTPAATSPVNTAASPVSGDSTLSANSIPSTSQAATTSAPDEAIAPTNKSKQRAFAGYNKFRPFSVGIDAGGLVLGGIGINNYSTNNLSGAVGLNASYFFGRAFALEADFHYNMPMSGSGPRNADSLLKGMTYSINSFDFTVNGVFNLGNINFTDKKNRWMVYGSIGAGVVVYSTKLQNTVSGVTSTTNSSGTSMLLPVGLGIKYKVNNDITARAGYMVKFADTDKMAAYYETDKMDRYSYGYIGIAYTLGNKKKPALEWNNAALAMYDDLAGNDRINPLKKKITSLQDQIDSLNSNYKNRLDSLKNDLNNLAANGGAASSMGAGMTDAKGKLVDSDGDGIPDIYDRCPFEKGSPAFGGCPKRSMKAGKKESSAMKNAENKIFFEKNSQKLNEDAYKALDALADVMKKNAGYKLLISGYTDADGDKSLNERLSLERANSVKAYLVKKGIEESRLKTEGMGEKVYFDNNVTSAGKRNNRVVTLEYVTY